MSGDEASTATADTTTHNGVPIGVIAEAAPADTIPPPPAPERTLGAEELHFVRLLKQVDALPPARQPGMQQKIRQAIAAAIEGELGETSSGSNGRPPQAATATSAPAASSAIAPTPKVDPHDFPAGMMHLPEGPAQWTIEAIEASAYEHEGRRLYPPLDGLCIDRIERPDGSMIAAFELMAPHLVQDSEGRIVRAERGAMVLAHAPHAMRTKLAQAWKYQEEQHKQSPATPAYCRVVVRPTLPVTSLTGGREMALAIRIEPDPDNPRRPKLYTREAKK